MIRLDSTQAEELAAILADYAQLAKAASVEIEIATNPHRAAVDMVDEWISRAKVLRGAIVKQLKES